MKYGATFIFAYYWVLYTFVNITKYSVGTFSVVSVALNIPILIAIAFGSYYIFKLKYKKSQIYLLLFGVSAILAAVVNGDIRGVLQIFLFAGVFFIVKESGAHVPIKYINIIFLFTILVSIVSYHVGLNEFGYLPGQYTYSDNYVASGNPWWRINLFPFNTIPYSAAFGVCVIIANFSVKKRYSSNNISIILAFYFVLFSGSRTAYLSVLSIIALYFLLRINMNKLSAVLPVIVLAGSIVLVLIPLLVYNIDTPTIINYAMFRSAEKPPVEEVYSAPRPILWKNLISVYLLSPISGYGYFDLYSFYPNAPSHSECKWLSLLARYGISVIIFFVYLYKKYLISIDHEVFSEYAIIITMFIYFMFYGSLMSYHNLILILMLFVSNISYAKIKS